MKTAKGVDHEDASFADTTRRDETPAVFDHGALGEKRGEFRDEVGLIESGRVDVASIVTHRYGSLEQAPEALANGWRADDYVKGIVTL